MLLSHICIRKNIIGKLELLILCTFLITHHYAHQSRPFNNKFHFLNIYLYFWICINTICISMFEKMKNCSDFTQSLTKAVGS